MQALTRSKRTLGYLESNLDDMMAHDHDNYYYRSSDLSLREAEWNTEVVFSNTGIGKSKSAKVSNFNRLGYNGYGVALSFHWLQRIIVIMTLVNSWKNDDFMNIYI